MAVAALVLAAGSILSIGVSGSATAAAPRPAQAALVVKIARITNAGAEGRLGLDGPDQGTGIVIENVAGEKCLDANDSGSTAGKDGDKVQLWTCTGAPNQIWYVGAEDSAGNWELYNGAYPSKCLNARDSGGLGDGSHAQLWGCVTSPNAVWDLSGWINCLGKSYYCPIYLESDNYKFVLDATLSGDHDNGDQIQIWTPNSGANQDWVNLP
jgi:Ricin-type beta-trefoil lectin domain-like